MRKRRNDFKTSNKGDVYYDIIGDYELIEASFAEQYGIRLRYEDEMSWGEFLNLLCGLNDKTALGKIVSIRSEKNPKIIKEFTKEQKAIRSKWQRRNVKEMSKEEYTAAMQNFKNMFMAISNIKR